MFSYVGKFNFKAKLFQLPLLFNECWWFKMLYFLRIFHVVLPLYSVIVYYFILFFNNINVGINSFMLEYFHSWFELQVFCLLISVFYFLLFKSFGNSGKTNGFRKIITIRVESTIRNFHSYVNTILFASRLLLLFLKINFVF